MIRLDESFDGGSVTLRVGQRIDLALAENASTGYRWHPARPCPPVASPALREIDEAFAAGAHDYLLKPLNYAQLLGKVAKALAPAGKA